MSDATDEQKLKKYFIKNLNNGKILRNSELKKYSLQRKFNVSSKYIRSIRNKVIPTLMYKPPIKIKAYQTITVDRLGLLSMDFAYYPKDYKKFAPFNNGIIGFLVVNSVIASKYHAIPMKSLKISEFEKALEEICKGGIFPAINVILSDREKAITSLQFRQNMLKKYGIRFQSETVHFLMVLIKLIF